MSLLSQFFGGGTPGSPGDPDNRIPVETLIVAGGGGSGGSVVGTGAERFYVFSLAIQNNGLTGAGGGGGVFFGKFFMDRGATAPVVVGAGGNGGELGYLDCTTEVAQRRFGSWPGPSYANAPLNTQQTRLEYFENLLGPSIGSNGSPSSFNGYEVLGGGGGGTFCSRGRSLATGGGVDPSFGDYFHNMINGAPNQRHLVLPISIYNKLYTSGINLIENLKKYIPVIFSTDGTLDIVNSGGLTSGQLNISGNVNPFIGTLSATGTFSGSENDAGIINFVIENEVKTPSMDGRLYGNPAVGFSFNGGWGGSPSWSLSSSPYNNNIVTNSSLVYARGWLGLDSGVANFTGACSRLGGGASKYVLGLYETRPIAGTTRKSTMYITNEPAILTGFESGIRNNESWGTRYAGSFQLVSSPTYDFLDENMKGAGIVQQFGYHATQEDYDTYINPSQPAQIQSYMTAGRPGNAGVVILRYPDSYAAVPAPQRPGSTDLSPQTPGYRTYKYESSGSITFPE